MADLEELVVRIKADATALEREMKKAQGVVQQSSNSMKGSLASVAAQAQGLLPALSVAAVAAFAKSALMAADRLNDLAQRTGVAASTLSALNIPLLQSGSNVDEFAASINRLNNMIGEAAKGTSQEAVKAFDDLGLSVQKLRQLSPEQQFYEVSKALSQMGSQSEMTNAGMAIFGRGFASMIPLIKQAGGDLEGFISKQKEMGSALSEEQLQRIDEFGDRWTESVEKLKLAMANALPVLTLYMDGLSAIVNLPENAYKAGQQIAKDLGIAGNPNVSFERPKTVNEATFKKSARGSNSGMIANKEVEAARKSLADYNKELERQSEYARLAPSEAAARKAYYEAMDLAQKAGIQNYEAEAQRISQTVIEQERLKEAMQESTRFAAELKDQFAETAGSILRDSKNAGDALTRLGEALADMLTKRYILGPIADSLFGTGGSGGGILGSVFSMGGSGGAPVAGGVGPSQGTNGIFGSLAGMLGFADGGNPPVNVPSVVGERGPEIFVPKVAGTVIPNHALGGMGSVTIVQNNSFAGGVSHADLARALPSVAAAARNAVFDEMKRGGGATKIARNA